METIIFESPRGKNYNELFTGVGALRSPPKNKRVPLNPEEGSLVSHVKLSSL